MSSYRTILLHDGTPVKVDADDYARLSKYRWSKTSSGYARTGSQSARMHRMIVRAPKGMVVDHINGDIHDNRKSNLRICTPRENGKNHSQTCVYFDQRHGTWHAGIKVDYQTFVLGTYATEAEAEFAYHCAALYYFGEFARDVPANAVPKSAAQLKHESRRARKGFVGVRRAPRGPSFHARITIQGKEHHLGAYATPEEAARAYDRAVLAHGFPAWRLNFPPDEALQ